MYQRATTDRSAGTGQAADAASRLAALAAGHEAAADLIDALAEALLELPGTIEVHVRRWPDAVGCGFAAAYWPGDPVRCRSYIAASWDSGALRSALDDRRPVRSSDPAELPAGLVGRMAPGTPITILPLGADEEAWGVVAVAERVAERVAQSANEAALEAMATLAAMAGLRLGSVGTLTASSSGSSVVEPWAFSSRLVEEVGRAAREGSGAALLMIGVQGSQGLAPEVIEGSGQVIAGLLHEDFGDLLSMERLERGLFGVLLPAATVEVADALARRVVHRLGIEGPDASATGRPPGVVVRLAGLHPGESADAFLSRAKSLLIRSESEIRGVFSASAGPAPNLPG